MKILLVPLIIIVKGIIQMKIFLFLLIIIAKGIIQIKILLVTFLKSLIIDKMEHITNSKK